jgi:hypothetical protein
MSRSTLRTAYLFGLAALAALHASPALAEPKDDAALELAKKAIYTDYLGTKFEDAEKKLQQAIALCGQSDCSAAVKAQLHRDLGTVYFGGMNRQDEGKAEFLKALQADPKIELDAELATPEMQVAWNEAKKGAGSTGAGNAGASPSGGAAGAGGASPAPQGAAAGDMVHTPPAEQAILTPVPLYAELPPGTAAARVVLNYKAFGINDWKAVEMKRVGNGYGLEVPCSEIGSLTGTLKYFIQAFDAQSTPVSWSGTRNQPHSVAIVQERAGEAPHLPGQPPPSKCADAGDCPPEFPGCKALGADKDKPCEGESCPETPPPDTAKKNWVSLAVQQDFLFLGGETNSCAGTGSYQCFRQTGEFYDLIPYDKSGGEIAGGINVATTRIMAGYDRVVWRFKLGVRLGFAFGGGPQAPDGLAFMPFHAEGRASYWFGADPFGTAGPKFYLTAGGGVAQLDSKVTVVVYETRQDYLDDKRLKLDAWRKSGTGFLAAGAGFLYAITPRTGPFAEARVIQMLGAANTGLGLQLGYAFGF